MKTVKPITIVHLYPREMNIYGDRGNVLTLARRLQWHGYTPKVVAHNPGKPFPNQADIIIGGGGQDSGQNKVQEDLLRIGDHLHKLADGNVPMLMICGLYQLFGRFFKTSDDEIIKGIEIFKAETHAGSKRLIGNIMLNTDFGEVIGYENHSGLTVLDDSQHIFGTVKKGAGNNGTDHTEGAVYKNVYGSYLHGSLLPKNPVFADALIEAAVVKRYGEFEPEVIDDRFAQLARNVAISRPR
jgi:lipid II isoglutaminyl synthase (glutamine-hydrolysing)